MPANPIYEVLELVVNALTKSEIDYVVTGSVASGLYGEPVTTQDVDIVVRMTEPQARRFAQSLPQRFYRDEESLATAAQDGGLVNVIDMETSFKVDVSVVAATPFYKSVFQRSQGLEFEPGAMKIKVVSPEDIILMKLEWRKESKSTKQWQNALSVAQVRGARMDWKYLFGQARELGIEEDLVKLRDDAGI